MEVFRSSSASQFISAIAIVQTVVVMICFFGLGIVMRLNGYPDTSFGVRWYPLPLFLRTHFGLLMLIPFLWTVAAIWLELRMEDNARAIAATLAAVLMLILVLLSLMAMMDPDCRLMTRDEILKIRDATIQSAVLAKQAGFDGVDVKLCHAFFGAELIAPRNTRDDEYGGSFENRTRFLREIIRGIRSEAPDLLLIARMSIFENGPGEVGTAGLDDPSPDTSEVDLLLELMVKLGLHIASVTGPPLLGWPEKYSTRPTCEEDLYRALRLPGYVKQALVGTDLLTLNTGNSVMGDEWPHAARFCIENGLTDLVGFGKQSLADPMLPVKYAEGRAINACCLRMGCVDHYNQSAPIRCDEYPDNL